MPHFCPSNKKRVVVGGAFGCFFSIFCVGFFSRLVFIPHSDFEVRVVHKWEGKRGKGERESRRTTKVWQLREDTIQLLVHVKHGRKEILGLQS
jgi:hypothetical protein